MQTITEKKAFRVNGYIALTILFILVILEAYLVYEMAASNAVYLLWIFVPGVILTAYLLQDFWLSNQTKLVY